MRQRSVIVVGRVEPDPYWQVVTCKGCGETLKVIKRVQDRHSATALLARDADQHLMAMASSKIEVLVSVPVIAGLLSGVVLQNHC